MALIRGPEDWDPDLEQFLVRYMLRFRTFLEVLQECEAKKIKSGLLLDSQCLSTVMENSLENGLF